MRKIYVDLDETLIHARVAGSRPPGKRRRFAFGLEVYDVALRPCARYLLGCLREIGCVSLLKTSRRDYAEKINEAFGLGFEELYCREDIFIFRPFADLKTEAVAPQSVLIDDLSPTETLARLKMKFRPADVVGGYGPYRAGGRWNAPGIYAICGGIDYHRFAFFSFRRSRHSWRLPFRRPT